MVVMSVTERDNLYRLKLLVNSFFNDYLNQTEESDGGNIFHPIRISCCRVLQTEPLNKLMKEMEELSK